MLDKNQFAVKVICNKPGIRPKGNVRFNATISSLFRTSVHGFHAISGINGGCHLYAGRMTDLIGWKSMERRYIIYK